jgi:hypothetical protein
MFPLPFALRLHLFVVIVVISVNWRTETDSRTYPCDSRLATFADTPIDAQRMLSGDEGVFLYRQETISTLF